MQKIVIKLGLLAVMLLTALPAVGQRATIRDINAIPQSQIDVLNAGGENLMAADITANIYGPDFPSGTEVTFEAVIMTDPRKSGLSNVTDGRVDRVHMFVRDTSAATLGPDGMGIQVVDGSYDTNNLLAFGVGDVIQVTGTVSPFGTAMQVSPTTITLLGDIDALGLPASILDPIVITTDEANMAVGATGGVQTNWNNLARLRNAFVRIENATIQTRSLANPDRPDFYISTDQGTTVLNFYDTGLQFRNDRQGVYPSEFLGRVDSTGDALDFEPPPPGSLVNMQGVLIFQGGADQIGRGVPANGLLSLAPFDGETDLVLLESPPVISDVTGPDFVPDGTAPVSITFLAQADPTRTLTSNACEYFTSEDPTVQTVDAMESGDTLACEIPAQADGVFVTYNVVSTDNTGAISTSDQASYRTLADGIDSISDIQLTVDEGPGNSPFSGITTDMDITATVQTSPMTSGIIAVQDDSTLAGWSGIFIEMEDTLPELNPGDIVNITNATIERRNQFGFANETWLTGTTLTVESTGGDILGYKSVDTNLLQDESIAAAHEGMLLRFDNVQITDNDTGFGQWAFATIDGDSTQASVQGDDVSPLIAGGDELFAGNEKLEYIQGAWLFAFGSFRVLPEDSTDIGMITNVANEDEILPNSFALHQNFPNPFNPTTTISYQISQQGPVLLEVYDMLGRRVATLVDGSLTAGPHTSTFDASNLASGVYLYRLQAGNDVTSRKMLLLK